MIKFEVIEDTFFKRNSFSYTLSILIGMDSVTYMITDSGGAVVVVKEYDFSDVINSERDFYKELEALFSKNQHLKSGYARIKVGFTQQKAALVPERLYDEKRKRTYLEHLTDIDKEQPILLNVLSALAVKNIFPFQKSLEDICKKHFPGADIFHLSTALLSGFFKQTNVSAEKKVFVHLLKEEVHIACFNQRKLVFYNSFSIKTTNDLIYYILLVYEQHGLDQENVPVLLSGKVLGNSEYHRSVQRYFSKVSFMGAPSFVQTGPRLSLHPLHTYFDLWSLQLCG